MKWRLWYGEDKKTDVFLKFFFSFIILALLICSVYIATECYKAVVIDREDPAEMILLSSLFTILPVCLIPCFSWQISKYTVDMNGIIFKSIFGKKKVVKWREIKAARIFTLYQKGNLEDGEFIMCVMNANGVPEKLTIPQCYFSRRSIVVVVRATPERLKEFSQFCPVLIKYGKQTGNKCDDTFEEALE